MRIYHRGVVHDDALTLAKLSAIDGRVETGAIVAYCRGCRAPMTRYADLCHVCEAGRASTNTDYWIRLQMREDRVRVQQRKNMGLEEAGI